MNQRVINTSFRAAWKVSKYGVISGPYIPTFALNTERYFVSFRIQSECGKIRTRNNSAFRHFLLSIGKSCYYLRGNKNFVINGNIKGKDFLNIGKGWIHYLERYTDFLKILARNDLHLHFCCLFGILCLEYSNQYCINIL